MKKKILAVILGMTMAAALLAGCSSEQKESSAGKDPCLLYTSVRIRGRSGDNGMVHDLGNGLCYS